MNIFFSDGLSGEVIMDKRFKAIIGEYLPPLLPLLLAAATFAVYARIFSHDFVTLWDDNFYVTNNPDAWGFSWINIQGAFTNFYAGNYAPVQILSYMLDYTVWKFNPAGYLLSNILLHIINGLLFFRILARCGQEKIVALSATALFLLHPLQVETVAWVSQRKSLLAILFMLIAWEFYCRWRESLAGNRWIPYAVSVAAFILSLLSKSVTVVFPLILILYDSSFTSDKRLRLRDKLPFLVAALLVAIVTFIAQEPGSGGRTDYHGGSPWVTFLSMLPVFCRYLGMLFWPFNLSADYAAPVHATADFTVMTAFLLLSIISVAGWRLWKTNRPAAFWILFFWLGLLPVSQVVPLVTMMNDRYLYLPLMGATALFGMVAGKLGSAREGEYLRPVNVAIVSVVAAAAIISVYRTAVWRDSITLFGDVVTKYPNSERGWRNFAEANQNAGKIVEARRIYEQALVVKPDNQTALVGFAEFLNSTGKLDEAYPLIQKLLKLNPGHASGWFALGDNLQKKKNYEGAEKAYLKVLEIQPNALPTYQTLGDLATLQRRFDAGRAYFDTIESKKPGLFEPAYRRACLEAQAGSQEQALYWLELAIKRGYNDFDEIYDNSELEILWNTPRFMMLLDTYFPGKVPR
jgi:Tfp pilus assembly protein PilF/4-amino-4-deoxy-L-arabinose transferase-like glycosyltransferase